MMRTFLHSNRRVLLSLAGLAILVWVVWSEWTLLMQTLRGLDAGLSLISLVLLCCANFCIAVLFMGIARHVGVREATRLEIMATYLVSQVAKYLPGKVWSVAMQSLYLGNRVGNVQLVLVNIELAFVALVLTTVIGLALLAGLQSSYVVGMLVLVMGAVAIQWMLARGLMVAMALWLVRKLRIGLQYSQEQSPYEDSWRAKVALFLLLIIFASLYIAGWGLLSGPAIGQDLNQAMLLVAVMALSYVIGMLSLVPAGLGVRELAMIVLGGLGQLDPSLVAAIALVTRAMLIALDVVTTLAGGALLIAARAGRGR